jgi:hypothetical protein
VVVTMPIGRRRRLFVAWTQAHGLSSVVWRAACGDLPSIDDDPDEGLGGVREPRRPLRPLGGSAVAMPPDPVL